MNTVLRFVTICAFLIGALIPGLAENTSAAESSASKPASASADTRLWVGIVHGKRLYPIGWVSNGKWTNSWVDQKSVLKSKPPKTWLINGGTKKLEVSKLNKARINCDKTVWGYSIPKRDENDRHDIVALSLSATDLIDRTKKNWDQEQIAGEGESMTWSRTFGVFRLESGKLTISEGGGYESLRFSVKWEPTKGKVQTESLSAGGC